MKYKLWTSSPFQEEMANCCYVEYKCVGKREQMKELLEALHLMMDREMPVENKWGKTWMGWLVSAFYGDADAYTLRGRILDFKYDKEVLTVIQETDWEEQRDMRVFLKEQLPEVDIYYMEEEPGGEVFSTNDVEGRFFPYRYMLEGNDDSRHFCSIEEAAQIVADIVGHEVAAAKEEIDDALDEFMEEHEDEFFSFHHFDIGDTSLLRGAR